MDINKEREAFRAAHRELDLSEKPDAWGRPQFLHSHVEATWRGWQAGATWQRTQAAVMPEGWKLVPVNLTTEQIAADPYGMGYGRLHAVWRALLAAAPAQPAARQEPVVHACAGCVACEGSPESNNNPCHVCGGTVSAAHDQGEVQRLREALEEIRHANMNGPVSESNAGCIKRIEQIAERALADHDEQSGGEV